ncbi:hypothetical protein Tco_1559408, partial [Tanacetum coccineum]
VRISQKSQENGQNRTNTDTGTELSVQEPGEFYQRFNHELKSKGNYKLATWLRNSSVKGQGGRVKRHGKLLLVQTQKGNDTWSDNKHKGDGFYAKTSHKGSTRCHNHGLPCWQSV